MPIATCPMCLEEKQLIRSHLMSSALYDLCDAPDSDPVLVTSEVMMQTGRELKDYLLCQPCDNQLSEQGEKWLLPRLATMHGNFPLYDLIQKLPPDGADGDSALYLTARNSHIETDKILHYAMGMFFKAAVHPWRGGRTDPLINLGKYTEAVRKFVKDGGPFPKNMALVVGISPPPVHEIMITPPYRGQATDMHNFVLGIPGMQFVLLVGRGVSAQTKQTCFAPSPLRPLLVSTELGGVKVRVARHHAVTAHKSKKVLDYVKNSAFLQEYRKNRQK